ADESFEREWQRVDQPVARNQTVRSWVWGPRALMARTEAYVQATGGLRQVQYFDKARMEVSDADGNRASRWFVTTGLLAAELVTGRMQVGNSEFVERAAPAIPVAGDETDTSAPTYATFAKVVTEAAPDRTGQLPNTAIDRAGTIGDYTGAPGSETRFVHYVAETGHNLPGVFWDFVNASGPVQAGKTLQRETLIDWVFTLGYPISEPYWTTISVGGQRRDVLVQVFQRRVLTYTPSNPVAWRVEMGNVGRHYYRWRYGEDLPPSQ
ncbi:MAG TPA: hypothetical protein VFT99_15605, partial [Roseiflexaceae bacterium]|nr:hypothetical protein [Roseiflexaceae bacterium]